MSQMQNLSLIQNSISHGFLICEMLSKKWYMWPHLKGIVHPKMKISWKCTYLQAMSCIWVVSLSEQILRNVLMDINWFTEVMWITVMFLSAVWTFILTTHVHCRAGVGNVILEGRCPCRVSSNPNQNTPEPANQGLQDVIRYFFSQALQDQRSPPLL